MTGRKGGAPRRQPERSTVRIMLRLTPEEHAEFRELGTAQGLSVGQLIRLTALSALGTARALEAGDTTTAEQVRSVKAIGAKRRAEPRVAARPNRARQA